MERLRNSPDKFDQNGDSSFEDNQLDSAEKKKISVLKYREICIEAREKCQEAIEASRKATMDPARAEHEQNVSQATDELRRVLSSYEVEDLGFIHDGWAFDRKKSSEYINRVQRALKADI